MAVASYGLEKRQSVALVNTPEKIEFSFMWVTF